MQLVARFVASSIVVLYIASMTNGVAAGPPPSNPPPPSSPEPRMDASKLARLIYECDLAAAHPFDKHKPAGIAGVYFAQMDPTRAVHSCDDAAAAAGYNDSNEVGRMRYEAGRAYERNNDLEEAESLYQIAFEEDHYVTAAHGLADFFLNGKGGLNRDIPAAVRLIEIAANDGFAPAQETLGRWYEAGINGLPQNRQKAEQLFGQAADQGYADARAGLERVKKNAEDAAQAQRQSRFTECYLAKQADCQRRQGQMVDICQSSSPSNAEYKDCIGNYFSDCMRAGERYCKISCPTCE